MFREPEDVEPVQESVLFAGCLWGGPTSCWDASRRVVVLSLRNFHTGCDAVSVYSTPGLAASKEKCPPELVIVVCLVPSCALRLIVTPAGPSDEPSLRARESVGSLCASRRWRGRRGRGAREASRGVKARAFIR